MCAAVADSELVLTSMLDPLDKEPVFAHRIANIIKTCDFKDAHDLLASTRDRWEERSFFVRRLIEAGGHPDWLDEWVSANSSSSLPWLTRGAQRAAWALEAGGSNHQKNFDAENKRVFAERLELAEQDLAKASQLDHKDPTPFEYLLVTRTAMGAKRKLIRALFVEANHRDSWNYPICNQMLGCLLWKRGGSHIAMFEFARSLYRKAPEGRPVNALLARAHFERWLAYRQENHARERSDVSLFGRWYFRNPLVRRELLKVWGKTGDSYLYTPGRYGRVAMSYLVFCLLEISAMPQAKEALTKTEGYIKEGLFANFPGSEEKWFSSFCRKTGVAQADNQTTT
jgi:hypothetical protein